jgi:hypothetical protein
MLTYLGMLISSGTSIAAFAAVLILSGGWEAAAAGVAVLAATVWLGCFVVMLAGKDSAPRGRSPRAV